MSDKKLTERTVKGLSWSLSSLMVQTLLNIASVSILARLLTPHDYGLMSAAFIVVAFGNTVAELGLAPTIIQKKSLSADHLATALTASIAIGIALMSLQWLCAPYLAAFMRMPELTEILQVLSVVLVVQPLASIYEAWLARSLRFKTVSIVKLGTWIFSSFGIAIPLALSGSGYWALAAGFVSQAFTTTIAFVFLSKNIGSKGRISLNSAKELLKVGIGFSFTRIMNYISIYSDNTIVGRSLGGAELGIYSRAFYMISLPTNMFGTASRMVVFPAMSHIQDDDLRLHQAYLKGVALTALMTIPTSAFLAIFSGEIVSIILGSQWTKATIPFAVFSAAIYFRVGAKTCANILLAKARTSTLAALQTVNAALIVSGALLSASYGLNAVCLAVCFAAAVSFIGYVIVGNRSANVSAIETISVHIQPLLIGLFVLITGGAVKLLMHDATAPAVICTAIFVIGMPLAIALYFKPSLLLGKLAAEVLAAAVKPIADRIGWRFFS